MKLGELIAAYRKENRMSQRQFAKKCGDLSNGYVSMLENDYNPATGKGITPTIDKLICIASGMDMSLTELLEKADDMPVDISEVVEQNVIYADEDDAEICRMFINAEKEQKIKEQKQQQQEDNELYELREELRRNPEVRLLFSASRGAKKEHIKAAAAMLNALKGNDDSLE